MREPAGVPHPPVGAADDRRDSIDPLTTGRADATESRIHGYRVASAVEITVRDLGRVGAIVDGAVVAGANVVGGLRFALQDRSRAEAEARRRAVEVAAASARQLADAAGVRLGPLVSIAEGTGEMGTLERVESAYVAAGPVEPGQLTISVTVELRYAFEP